MICQFSLEYVLDGKSFDKIFLRDFVASKVQVLKLVKNLQIHNHQCLSFWDQKNTLLIIFGQKKEDSSLQKHWKIEQQRIANK